jgi:hypothetical protein
VKLAIVGSVELACHPVAAQLIETVLEVHHPDVVVSGGAPGIDTMAEAAATRRGLKTEIFRPTVWRWAAPGGFKERNILIAQTCDTLVRIAAVTSTTYGSGWTRDRAKHLGKLTESYLINGDGRIMSDDGEDRGLRVLLMHYIRSGTPLEQFATWFRPQAGNIDARVDADTAGLYHDVDLLLAEYEHGDWTEEELKQQILALFPRRER